SVAFVDSVVSRYRFAVAAGGRPLSLFTPLAPLGGGGGGEGGGRVRSPMQSISPPPRPPSPPGRGGGEAAPPPQRGRGEKCATRPRANPYRLAVAAGGRPLSRWAR